MLMCIYLSKLNEVLFGCLLKFKVVSLVRLCGFKICLVGWYEFEIFFMVVLGVFGFKDRF